MTRSEFALDYLARKGVSFIVKTEYKDNRPFKKFLLTPLELTKTDQFFRINGKVVSKGMALEIHRLGLLVN